jgi:DNA repair exonuclease SbcCD ATPase subunit
VADDDEPPAGDEPDPIRELGEKLDTVAGALAAIASSHGDLLAHVAEAEANRRQAADELHRRLDALEQQLATAPPAAGSDGESSTQVLEAIERLQARTEDRLASVRDAAAAPLTDLQALLQARTDRDDHDVTQLRETLDRLAAEGPAAIREQLAALQEAIDELGAAPSAPPEPSPVVVERLEELAQAVQAVTWQVPEITEELAAMRDRMEGLAVPAPVERDTGDLGRRLTNHMDTALAGVLRLIDERLAALRQALSEQQTSSTSNVGGFEAGAVMGAAQAAWNRLEQRIDNEFDDLGRQLHAMAALIEHVSANTDAAAASRPVVTGDQLRRAASVVRDTVVSASRSRRERRGGPRGLGPGSGGA